MNTKKFKFPISALIIIVLSGLGNIAAFGEITSEVPDQPDYDIETLPMDVSEKSSGNNVEGQLIVKLKHGRTLADIQELNDKYPIKSVGEIADIASGSESNDELKELKEGLAKLDNKHDSWYWQLEKGSSEYKDYIERIEREKAELKEKITIQEEMIRSSGQTDGTNPEDTANLEYTYVLNVPESIDLIQMSADYKFNSAVEYAKINYVYK